MEEDDAPRTPLSRARDCSIKKADPYGIADGDYCTRSLWMTRLNTAWGILRTRYRRLCDFSDEPKSSTPGSASNILVTLSVLTFRISATSATV